MNKKRINIIIVVLMLVEISTIFLMYKSLNNKDEEIYFDNINNRDVFAIMLEQSDGTYKEASLNIWPTDMIYNEEMSGCIDNNGNKLDGVLSYDTNSKVAIVNTKETSYCYLYFDNIPSNLYDLCKSYNNINDCIKNENNNISYISDIWDSTLDSDGIRYVGENPNNYVCFGTSDKTTCTSDTDKYMYRIIGMFESDGSYHLKLIKKEALNKTYAWDTTYTDEVEWQDSDLYNGLNGSYFLSNTTYSYMQESAWVDKIVTWNYTATNTITYKNYSSNDVYGLYYSDNSPKVVYLHELNRDDKVNQSCHYSSYGSNDSHCSIGVWTTVSSKIGLMYVSDYMLSLGETYMNSKNNAITLENGWMHLSNNDSASLSTTKINPPFPDEWTMSRYDRNSSYNYMAWEIGGSGGTGIASPYLTVNTTSVRPVFYLTSNIKIIGGEGMLDNPFIIL